MDLQEPDRGTQPQAMVSDEERGVKHSSDAAPGAENPWVAGNLGGWRGLNAAVTWGSYSRFPRFDSPSPAIPWSG